jgi:uncharacterized membrane protein
VTVLAGSYGHPLHPILVTVPIGAWVTSLVFDIASHAVHPSAFLAQGSLWLIAVGAIGAVLAAGAGALDLTSVTRSACAACRPRPRLRIPTGPAARASRGGWRARRPVSFVIAGPP